MKYPVVETFQSIQGEGRFAGHPANFIRLAGCPNGCKFCDTDISVHEELTALSLVSRINFNLPMTVITGGEPCIHDLTPFIEEIRRESPHHFIAIETSGVRPITPLVNWITLSPKNGECRRSAFVTADEIKWLYPLYTPKTVWAIARKWSAKTGCQHYLQPINYAKRLNMKNVKGAIDEVINNTTPIPFKLSIQLHKIIHVR